VATGDFTGTGILDLAVANSGAPTSTNTGNTVSIYLGQTNSSGGATGTFAAGTERDFPAGTTPMSIAVGDYNVDGRLDLVVADESDNAISLLLNLGGGLFGPNFELPVETSPVSVASADFNGDNQPDVAVANSGSANVSVIINSSSFLGSQNGLAGTPYPGVEYLDVGLKVKATPRIHPNNDVSVQLAFDISSLAARSFNSIPVISNQTVEQTVRLKRNETAVLAGFLEEQVATAINGTPGIAEVPGAQWLAQNQNVQSQDSELLILVTPRLVRLAPREDHVIYAGQGALEGGGAVVTGGPGLGGTPPAGAAPQPRQEAPAQPLVGPPPGAQQNPPGGEAQPNQAEPGEPRPGQPSPGQAPPAQPPQPPVQPTPPPD